MSTQHTGQGISSGRGASGSDTSGIASRSSADQDANTSGAAPRGAGGGADRPNFGSARSDYGSRAYGGSLDGRGLGGKSVDDYDQGRREVGSRGSGSLLRRRGAGGGAGAGLMLLYGIGIGAGLMYILDPDQGRRRRALLRDKLVKLSNQAGDTIGKTSRDLRNRAQGVIAETSGMLGMRQEKDRQEQGADDQRQTDMQQAGAAGGSSR